MKLNQKMKLSKMAQPRVLIIGCGQMGRGISRMLRLEQKRQNEQFELWVYDPNKVAEQRCVQELENGFTNAKIQRLRTIESSVNYSKLTKIMKEVQVQPERVRKIISIMRGPISKLQPRIIINTATYFAHKIYVPLAIELGIDYIDLGQGVSSVKEQRVMESLIIKQESGSRIVHESGLAPGLANIIAASLYELAVKATPNEMIHSLQMRVGGLPQHTTKGGNLHYGPTFSVEGLLYEYENVAYGIRDGVLITPTTFSQKEFWEDSDLAPIPFGVMPFLVKSVEIQSILKNRVQEKFIEESKGNFYLKGFQARPTADGTSRMCFDDLYRSKVKNLEYKTLRFIPHYQTWSRLKKEETLENLLQKWKARINDPEVAGFPDMALLRVWVQSAAIDQPAKVEILALHDDSEVEESQAFTAMQHLTGWPTVLLTLALLGVPSGSTAGNKSALFRDLEDLTGANRRIGSVLQIGGIVTPYDLVNGREMLKMLSDSERIPRFEYRVPQEWN